MREEEEEREEEMLFFSFLLLSTSRDLSQLDSEDIIIHHRETKEQENGSSILATIAILASNLSGGIEGFLNFLSPKVGFVPGDLRDELFGQSG